MNLIEKYGSYEAVRQAAENYKKSGDRVTAAGLELQCLEYRRQHNIYEVGDDVVYEGEAGLEAVFQIEMLTKTGKPKTVKTKRFGNFPCRYCTVRHATDAEIQAGKRL